MSSTFSLVDARSTGLLPQVLKTKSALVAPKQVFDQCEQTLLDAKIFSSMDRKTHSFKWGSAGVFDKLTSVQAEAVYVICVAESLKILPEGATQKVINKLVDRQAAKAKAKVSAVSTGSGVLWISGALATIALGFAVYKFSSKRR
jgi:hypothetical protein